jgi:alkaline phosphatase
MKSRSIILAFFFLFVAALSVFPAGGREQALVQGTTASDTTSTGRQQARAKYVFLFIGDGMALAQAHSAEVYSHAISAGDVGTIPLSFTQFPCQGITTTYDASSIITDSASAGTAMATGNKTLSGVINMDTTKTVRFKTIAEYAHQAGFRVGIITSVSLDHATPASFYAKTPSRGNFYDIGVQMANSGFDFFGGGGLVQPTGKNKDQPDILGMAISNGYTVVNSVDSIKSLKPGSGKVIAINPTLDSSQAMPYDIDRAPNDLSLADYTAKAIELLDNPAGFFIMVEGGKIDWACHANDAAASIGDTIALDRAVLVAIEFYRAHPDDTIIIVTGDHETGGMSIGFAGTQYSTFFNKIAGQKGSFDFFNSQVLMPYKNTHTTQNARLEDLLPRIESFFGIAYASLADNDRELIQRAFIRSMKGEVERAPQESVALLYGGYEPLTMALTHVANQNAGVAWTSYSHTGVPVATYAMGAGSDAFNGYYDNTDIFRKLAAVMGITVAD